MRGKGIEKPKVSVIMPAFNSGRWIRQAINSVLSQTLTEFEVIIVDDGSTDDTCQVVKGIPDPRVRLFPLAENRGVSAARNLALDQAQGEWVAILDSDDWFARRDRLQALVSLGNKLGADIVADDIYFVEEGKSHAWTTMLVEKGLRFAKPQWIDALIFIKYDFGVIKPLIRTAFLRANRLRYDESLRSTEDWNFYLECLLAGARLLLVPQAGYCYRMRPGSLSRNVLALLSQAEANLRRYLEDERVSHAPDVLAALKAKLREVKENQRYYKVMAPIKEGRLSQGLNALLCTPDFPLLFLKRIPRMVRYRARRRLVRISLPD